MAGYFVSSTSEFFLDKQLCPEFILLFVFFLIPPGGILTRLTPIIQVIKFVHWQLNEAWSRVSGSQRMQGALLQGEGLSGLWIQERKGKDEGPRDRVPGLVDRFGMEPQSKK